MNDLSNKLINTLPPQIDLGNQINQQIEEIEHAQRQENATFESKKILDSFIIKSKIGYKATSSSWCQAVMPKTTQKNKILADILDIYINNSNSLGTTSYSLFITELTQKLSQDNFIEASLQAASLETRKQVFFDLFKYVNPSYFERNDEYDYLHVSSSSFNLTPEKIKEYIFNQEKIVADLDRCAFEEKGDPDDDYQWGSRRQYRKQAHKLQELQVNIADLEFALNSSQRIEFLNSLLNNLQQELETYISKNPAVFKSKVLQFHKNTKSEEKMSDEELNHLLTRLLAPSEEEASHAAAPEPTFNSRSRSFIELCKTFFAYLINQEPKASPRQAAVELTNKEKILSELGKSKALLQALEKNVFFTASSLKGSLNTLQAKMDDIVNSVNFVNANSMSALEVENNRVLNRTVIDLISSCTKASKLKPSQIALIQPEIEKILLSAIELSEHLGQEASDNYAQQLQKEAEVSAKLASIRTQAQAPKTMSLGAKKS